MVIATLGFVVVSLTVGIVASLANGKTVDKTHSASVSQK
jgi:hypothetical protein